MIRLIRETDENNTLDVGIEFANYFQKNIQKLLGPALENYDIEVYDVDFSKVYQEGRPSWEPSFILIPKTNPEASVKFALNPGKKLIDIAPRGNPKSVEKRYGDKLYFRVYWESQDSVSVNNLMIIGFNTNHIKTDNSISSFNKILSALSDSMSGSINSLGRSLINQSDRLVAVVDSYDYEDMVDREVESLVDWRMMGGKGKITQGRVINDLIRMGLEFIEYSKVPPELPKDFVILTKSEIYREVLDSLDGALYH